MIENLSYLFLSGIVLGSGPCLSFCAPFLIIYTAAQKKGFGPSLYSYSVFSLGRLVSYVFWGFVCALGAAYLQSETISRYTQGVYFALGIFIVLLGIATCLGAKSFFGKTCAFLNKGNIHNVGVAGFLVGLSPCLPLFAMLNYVVLIAKSPLDAMMFLLVFGLGTVLSPLAILVAVSGKVTEVLSRNEKMKHIVQYVSGGILIFLGLRIVFAVINKL